MKIPTSVNVSGIALRVRKDVWYCLRCGRAFNLPRVPNTCEVKLGLCFTCYAIESISFDDDEIDFPP